METAIIYETERTNAGSVFLYKEGVFWRAYQHSAYFVVRDLKKCVPLKKRVKKIDAELVYIGFPDSGLGDFMTKAGACGFGVGEQTEKQIVLTGFDDLSGYDEWVEGIAEKQASQANVSLPSGCETCCFREVGQWQLASLTPMEVMVKLSELQRLFKTK